jgi:hypothetical protein
MIMLGLVEEGMTCIEAVRQRYDGERRNPWNEFECGNNYARSMASYALLNAFAGFQFDMVNQRIGFNPVQTNKGHFRCFWSLDSGWGEYVQTPTGCEVRVLAGTLTLRQVNLPALAGNSVAITVAGEAVAATAADDEFTFAQPAQIAAGQSLQVATR